MSTKNPRLQVVLPNYLADFVLQQAKGKGVSVSEVIRDMVKDAKRLGETK